MTSWDDSATAGGVQRGAVLFDLDGVLIDSGQVVVDVWRAWAQERDIDPERVIAIAHGRRTREVLARVAPELDGATEAVALEREAVRHHAPTIEGAADLYRALPDWGRAIATSASRETAFARLQAAELEIPRVLVSSDDVASGKPAPDCYLLAAATLEIPAADCIVVEDAPAGIEAARTAGMRVIALTTTHAAFELGEADVCLSDPADLTLAVERLRRTPVER